MTQAQTNDVRRNADGSIDKEVILKTFESHVNSQSQLPLTDEEGIRFSRNFLEELDFYDDNYGTYRIKDNSPETADMTPMEISKQCIEKDMLSILKKKRQEIENQESENKPQSDESDNHQWEWIVLTLILLLILTVVVVFVIKARRRNEKARKNILMATTSSSEGNTDIVVRRKTTSILHKQSLDDVFKDSNYLAVNCSDFCNDSAVKTMYIKNTCIIDIYNMYAEDLRNPNNPKEDGCMVLGRWIRDAEKDEYCVSLEEIVKPGDDAIFAEYELNFGAKIKLKVSEKLRKLRRETDLQYDLTCWVHSHPGLGVFFSNTDCSLHLLHKHPTYPKFLTAIVIDILTPTQELGIFTFKHDLNINSKADLTKLYSLEEWYKWAVESSRTSIKPEDLFNTLATAKSRISQCYSVGLTNSVIIDIDKLTVKQEHNPVYYVHGFTQQQPKQTTYYIAAKVEDTESISDNELIGCFVLANHCSIPSIKKAIANYLDKIKFVLVYSKTDGLVTTIPIISNDLCTDETYYGEQLLEELKIWTRRKR
jgi:hypothetical protein